MPSVPAAPFGAPGPAVLLLPSTFSDCRRRVLRNARQFLGALTTPHSAATLNAMNPGQLLVARRHVDLRRTASAICRCGF
ncbi:putative leader peptide [Catenulispora yoronensis]|uniref:putative leader peptide n=1 Tax=Catenulispora yoronensis TaxID=450799 RepID=UPI0036256911